MESSDLLNSLRGRGVRIWVDDGGQLRFSAPKGALTASDLQDLRRRRTEVSELLASTELLRGVRPRGRSQQPVPLTALQLRKWRHAHELRAGLSERTCVISQRILGLLQRETLRVAFRAAINRHDALRIRFVETAGTVHQYADTNQHELEMIDLAGAGSVGLHDDVVARCERLVAEKVPLRTGPLLSAQLFRLSSHDHVLIVAMDHMISDGVSCHLVAEEIWATYRRATEGSAITSSEPPSLHFLDYVAWQHRTRDAWLTQHGSYWKQRLTDLPSCARPRALGALRACRTLDFTLDEQLTAQVRCLAQRERTLPALVVLSLYAAAAARWLGRFDLLLAFVSNGRDRPELQEMVGFLADYLHLRVNVGRDDNFIDLLRRVAAEFRSAYEHQDFGRAPDLVPDCKPELCFNWLPAVPVRQLSDHATQTLTVEPFPLRLSFPLSDPITVAPLFVDQPTRIAATIYYQPDVFAAQQIERLTQILRSTTEQAMHRPGAPIIGAP